VTDAEIASAATILLAPGAVMPGVLIAGRYEVLAALGEGGMGAVYRVLDRELREEIALKVLRPELTEADGVLDRFRREVKLARRVTHPNVARTYDLGRDGALRFLTMELVDGEPLSNARGRALPLPDALRITQEIARGLSAAHAAGVVHRDLKPGNVMIARDGGRVVLTDFGIARTAHATLDDQNQTTTTLVGTPAYMAPEQFEGTVADEKSDLYALGLILFELLIGEPPVSASAVYAIAAARLAGTIPDLRGRDASIPDPVAGLVVDLLARRREDRPSATDVVERLERLRGGGTAGIAGARVLPPLPDPSRYASRTSKPIARLPVSAVGEAARALAAELDEALGDAVGTVKGVVVVPQVRLRTALSEGPDRPDPAALGRAVGAGTVLESSVRVEGDDARVRLRLVDPDRGIVVWADRVDGTLADPFALEDATVRAVTDVLRARAASEAARGGPPDPRVRAFHERARAAYGRFVLSAQRQARSILEEGLAAHPSDPWLESLLGAVLARIWLQTGATDRELVVRAEEACLRALSVEPDILETFHTLAVLRAHQGDVRAASRGFLEVLGRAPLHAEAHAGLARLLVETGHLDEGLARYELATQLDPALLVAWFDLAVGRALAGDREGALAAIAEAEARGGPLGGVFPRLRLVLWWGDRAMATLTADALEAAPSGAIWDLAIPLLRHFARGEPWAEAQTVFDTLVDGARGAVRHQAFLLEHAAEYFAETGDHAAALARIERAAELPHVDLSWLDRCPSLDPLRTDPRFVAVRAKVAARAARIW
jgi:serine/threonine-protein kinase